MLSVKQEKLIDEVLDEFDFDRVHEVMKLLNWQWQTACANKREIPSHYRLITSARNSLRNSVKNGFYATGGFAARYHSASQGEDEWFTLEFVVCSASNYG